MAPSKRQNNRRPNNWRWWSHIIIADCSINTIELYSCCWDFTAKGIWPHHQYLGVIGKAVYDKCGTLCNSTLTRASQMTHKESYIAVSLCTTNGQKLQFKSHIKLKWFMKTKMNINIYISQLLQKQRTSPGWTVITCSSPEIAFSSLRLSPTLLHIPKRIPN